MRIFVFRAAEAGLKTVEAVAALGHEAILAPVTRIVATDGAPPPAGFDAVLATSANAFAFSSVDRLRPLPVLAIGKTTAEAARRGGFADIRTSTGDAVALVALVRLTLPRSAKLLYLAGRDRKPILEEALVEAGYAVETTIAYEAEAVPRWPDDVVEALKGGRLAGALHFSRRSAELALDLAGRHHARAAVLALDHYCLSQDVAEPMREAGAVGIHVASSPEEARLLALLPPAGQ